ncbi:hypothetical protein E1B28_006829 [Marasmius oreades]|uniref:Uncharacterized protein n=1 Tax=Marasmius oreades TaxID=181124 RepID=A0A9P7UWV4_9AGAR|nr:uncharacterized protein E1B28_006829 [Marasmius oreades]KAG7096156.1 hypothetical protein E1B28_006829 [Marasmius oreades]
MGSSSPTNSTLLMELRPANGSRVDVDRERDTARFMKDREREHDRERENHYYHQSGPPVVSDRVPIPRERERDYERDRPVMHHAQTLPTPIRRSPLPAQLPSTSKSNSRPSSPKLYYPYSNGSAPHPHDTQRRHTVTLPPSSSSSAPSLGRPSRHSDIRSHPETIIVQRPLPSPSAHPTSYSRHQLHPQRHPQSQGRDEDVIMVSPISPQTAGVAGPPFAPRSAHPTSHSTHPNPPIMRRSSMVGSSGIPPLHGSSAGTGATATSPILVSPADPEDPQKSSILGKRERDREPDSRRNSASGASGPPLARSRSRSGSGSRPSSVVLAPHLVRSGHGGPVVRTSDSPRTHPAAHAPPPPPPHPSSYSHPHPYSHPSQPQRSSPHPTPHSATLPHPSSGTVYSNVLPAPGSVPPGSVVYVYGYPPPGQSQPSQMVHPSQSQPPVMTSGSHASPLPTPHPQSQTQHTPVHSSHSPLTARPPISIPPSSTSHPHSQSQNQPVQRRQTYPQQVQNQPAQPPPPPPSHSHSHSHPQSHHAHHPSQTQQHPHHNPHHSQSQSHQQQQPSHHSGKLGPHSPSMKHAVLTPSQNPTGSSQSQQPHPHHPYHPPSASSSSSSAASSVTSSFQQILNTTYLDLLTVVNKETNASIHSFEKERARREKLERALEERDRLLRQRDEEILTLNTALRGGTGAVSVPVSTVMDQERDKDKAMSKLQSDITHLKGELMGLKDDNADMQEEIEVLHRKLAAGGGDNGGGKDREVERLRVMESKHVAEITMLTEQVERWREEARTWREEKMQLVGSLDETERELRALIEQRKQVEESSANAEQSVSMITTSPIDAITASPLPFTGPLPSLSPRPTSRQSNLNSSPHHAQSIPVPPIMGSLPSTSPRNQLVTTNDTANAIGRPGSRSGVVDERRHPPHHSHPPPRPHVSLPASLTEERPLSARPLSAVSPYPSMSLPLPTLEKPSPRLTSAHLSPNQLPLHLPAPSPSNSTSRPPSRPTMNGRKRSREDANTERGHRRDSGSSAAHEHEDVEKPETPSRADPSHSFPSLIVQEKASKVLKRNSGDDVSTSSAHSDGAGVPGIPTTKNPYLMHTQLRPKSGSLSVEDGVFRHVQHPHSKSMHLSQLHYQQQQQTSSSFWKNVPSSACSAPVKKDEEPKLSFKHFTLLYEGVGTDYVCLQCKVSTTTKRKAFPNTTPFPELLDHSWREHEERCKDILKYSPSKLTEEQVLLKGGGGVLLGKAAGSGHGGHKTSSSHMRKEKSNNK